jgi:hypothetical protein
LHFIKINNAHVYGKLIYSVVEPEPHHFVGLRKDIVVMQEAVATPEAAQKSTGGNHCLTFPKKDSLHIYFCLAKFP